MPAAYSIRDFLQAAFGALPEGVTTKRLRADSALYDEAGQTWAAEVGIEFAVSADMSEALAAKVQAIHDHEWQPYLSLDPRESKDEERQWAEVVDGAASRFIPGWARNDKKDREPFRYIAVRVRSRQRDLLEGDAAWRHFAVVTPRRPLRGLAGRPPVALAPREAGHRRAGPRRDEERPGRRRAALRPLRRQAGGRPLAWWRLDVLAHNALALMKATALPDELATAQPKTLHLRLLCVAGRLVRHARRCVLELYDGLPCAKAYVEARQRLLELARRRRVSLDAS